MKLFFHHVSGGVFYYVFGLCHFGIKIVDRYNHKEI